MFEFHKDKQRYFNMQYQNSKEFIVPFIINNGGLDKPGKILEIGCAEAGVLKAFTELGHICTGIELQENRVALAKQFMKEEYEKGQISFITRDIYDIDIEKDLEFRFDIIILKDVIEHIHNQEKFMNKLKSFLNPGGKVFFGFPPWYMPYGGHQQMCTNKLLSVTPYYHLLPMPIYKSFLRLGGEKKIKIDNLTEIKDTGISTKRFDKIVKNQNFIKLKRQFYLINPIYKFKFKLKPRKQNRVVSSIPYLRDLVSTCVYYLIENTDKP